MAMPPPVRGTSVGGGPEGSSEEALSFLCADDADTDAAVVVVEMEDDEAIIVRANNTWGVGEREKEKHDLD